MVVPLVDGGNLIAHMVTVHAAENCYLEEERGREKTQNPPPRAKMTERTDAYFLQDV